MNKLVLICLSGIFFLSSCNFGEKTEDLDIEKDFQTVEINGDYKVKLPKFMNESNDLNDEASLQYASTDQKLYAIVIDEPYSDINDAYKMMTGEDKDVEFGEFVDLYMSIYEEDPSIRIEDKSEIETSRVNGAKCKMLTVGSYIDPLKFKIYYQFAFYEGKEKYYTLMIWTMDKEKEKHLKTIDQIVNSFEALK